MAVRSIVCAAAAMAAFGAAPVLAEDADYYRGGWRTDGGEPHVGSLVVDQVQERRNRPLVLDLAHCASGLFAVLRLRCVGGVFQGRKPANIRAPSHPS